MYKNLVFCKPPSLDFYRIIEQFELKETLHNDRTLILENENIMFSFDKKVVRVFLYDGDDKKLVKKVKEIFYGK